MVDSSVEAEAFLADPLTRREMEVLSLLANGLSNREIADALTVTLSTVKWYTKQIYSKMGVNSRKSAVAQARSLGLLNDGSSRNTLPLETTRFIGREAELRVIKRNLKDPNCRLLTLIGLGGAGKTRLAIEAARELAQEQASLYNDGVYFVPLAGQNEAGKIVASIAGALNLHLSGTGEPAEQLFKYLRNKQMLLALDNFEHLLPGSELVAEILRQSPRIMLLITSREALNLREEWRYEVDGLPIPEPTAKNLFDNNAVQLFVERAARVRADFSAENNAACIARICRLVKGMPLAIELAASWIRALSCLDIADEIEASLDFLVASMRDTPERHHSMRVVFDQSWSRLSPAEQALYRSFSVFRGGFTLAAAKAVGGATPAGLTALVDKSLVKRDPSGRYRVHELLKQYAAEKLAAQPDEEREVRDRHSIFYSDLAFKHQPRWGTRDQLSTLEIFESEIFNLLQAWEWNLANGKVRRLDRMIFSINEYLFWQGHLQDGVQLCRKMVDRLSSDDAGSQSASHELTLVRCKGLLWESVLLTQMQNAILARERLEVAQELLDAMDESGPEFIFVQAHIWLQGGRTGAALGAIDEARRNAAQSLRSFSALDESWGMAAANYWLGLIASIEGNAEAAGSFYKESLALFSELGDRRNIASTIDAMAVNLRNMEQIDGVVEMHLEAITIARELNFSLREGWMLHNLCWTQWHIGDYEAGVDTSLASVSVAEEIGNDLLVAAGNNSRATCLLHLGQYQDALALAEDLYTLSLTGPFWQPMVPLTVGEAALALGDLERGYKMIEESSQAMLEIRPSMAAMPLTSLALAALFLGLQEEAESALQQAFSMAMKSQTELQARQALFALAILRASQSQQEHVAQLVDLALASGHCLHSKWYREISFRLLGQDLFRINEEAADPLPGQQPVWQMAAAYREGKI